MKRIILIDFSWLYNKYYYVAKYSASQKGGLDFGKSEDEVTLRMLKQFLNIVKNSYKDTKVILALDSPTSTLKNIAIFEGYKQNRNKEEKKEVYKNINKIISKINKAIPSFSFIKSKTYEADQLIASLVKKHCNRYEIIIFSGDKDLIQLTSFPNTYISDKFEKGQFIIKTDKELFEKFKNSKGEDFTRISMNKKDILKYRTLKGDTSDNLSPVFPRIKDTEIVDIIKNYWIDEEELSEERIYDIIDDVRGDNEKLALKLEANKDVWLRNYKIMDLLHTSNIEIKALKSGITK
jgi:5'-3' exonuclease